jgi:hypothetical protein
MRLMAWSLPATFVIATATGVAIGAWERASEPAVFFSPSNSVEMSNDSVPVGAHFTFGMTYVRQHTNDPVTVVSVVPQVVENSAEAHLRVWTCSPDLRENGAIGAIRGSLQPYCTRVVSTDGARLALTESESSPAVPDQLVLTVTPERPGTVLVKGLDLIYVQDGKLAHQTVGEFVRVRTK